MSVRNVVGHHPPVAVADADRLTVPLADRLEEAGEPGFDVGAGPGHDRAQGGIHLGQERRQCFRRVAIAPRRSSDLAGRLLAFQVGDQLRPDRW